MESPVIPSPLQGPRALLLENHLKYQQEQDFSPTLPIKTHTHASNWRTRLRNAKRHGYKSSTLAKQQIHEQTTRKYSHLSIRGESRVIDLAIQQTNDMKSSTNVTTFHDHRNLPESSDDFILNIGDKSSHLKSNSKDESDASFPEPSIIQSQNPISSSVRTFKGQTQRIAALENSLHATTATNH